MSAPQHESDDPERDAWLAQALRHAPDADAQAPPGLSEIILRQARAASAAAAPAAGTLQPGGLAALWHWLARPAVATGFASVMSATLVGVMWWGQPMDALPKRAEPPSLSAAPPPRPMPNADRAAAMPPAQSPPSGKPAAAPTAQRAKRLAQAPAGAAEAAGRAMPEPATPL